MIQIFVYYCLNQNGSVNFHKFQNYIFALLTGYMDPPAGVVIAENQHYNPYFPGGAIGMAQALYDEVILNGRFLTRNYSVY